MWPIHTITNNNETGQLQQNWDTTSNSWINKSLENNTYDPNNNLVGLLIQLWNKNTNSWVNRLKDSNEYNNIQQRTQLIQQEWDSVHAVWVNALKLNMTYNIAGNITLEYVIQWNFNNVPGWDTTGRAIYNYNTSNQLESTIDQGYNGFGYWANQDEYHYVYDSIGNLRELTELLDFGFTPVNFLKFTYTWALAGGALPVTLSDFNGIKLNSTSKLYWHTKTEVTADHYEIQRSLNNNFVTIGSVSANGTSTLEHDYSFIDKTPQSGINYYRLKQVDKDGNLFYSKIISLSFNDKPSFHVFPNPATEYVFIDVKEIPTGDYSIRLIDVSGKTVSSNTYLNSASAQQVNMPLSKYAPGMYVLELRDALNNVISQQKIIKR